jgi:hypothetical protein
MTPGHRDSSRVSSRDGVGTDSNQHKLRPLHRQINDREQTLKDNYGVEASAVRQGRYQARVHDTMRAECARAILNWTQWPYNGRAPLIAHHTFWKGSHLAIRDSGVAATLFFTVTA